MWLSFTLTCCIRSAGGGLLSLAPFCEDPSVADETGSGHLPRLSLSDLLSEETVRLSLSPVLPELPRALRSHLS